MYIILEFQTQKDGAVAIVPPVQKSDYFEAQQAFLQTASYAAVSTVPKHSVLLINEEGVQYDSKIFKHSGEEA